jgi:transposase, IS5 family
MRRERYAPMNPCDLGPTLSMAMAPVLTPMERLLDDDTLIQAVKADLIQRFPQTPSHGRPSTPVAVMLRMVIVKHLYGGGDEQTAPCVADRLVWRQGCHVSLAPAPDAR